MRTPYQLKIGDFVYLDFSPQARTEQAGRRPALVLSAKAFNIATGLCFVCPVMSQAKGGTFEVPAPSGSKITGVILSDHLRSVDWIARRAEFHSKAPQETVDEVAGRVAAIMSG